LLERLIGAGVSAAAHVRQVARLAAYGRAARRVRLSEVAFGLGPGRGAEITGRRGGLRVRVSDEGPESPTVVVVAGDTIPAGVCFECDGLGALSWTDGHTTRRSENGDTVVDDGSRDLVAAILRCRVPARRRGAQEHPLSCVTVQQGSIRAECLPSTPPGSLSAVLGGLLAFAVILGTPGRLAAVLRACLRDPDDTVHSRAVMALGAEGRDTLREMLDQPHLDDVLAARALRTVGSELGLEKALALLARSTAGGRRRTAVATLVVLARIGGEPAIEAIVTALHGRDTILGVAAAHVLRWNPGPGVEAALIGGLEAPANRVRIAAAEALGSTGTVGAVSPLRAAMAERTLDRRFDTAAGRAIDRIQSRLEGAEAGQLSLAGEARGGRLSLSSDESGRLSVSEGGAPETPHERSSSRPSSRGDGQWDRRRPST
jgi:HEAT repeat protein